MAGPYDSGYTQLRRAVDRKREDAQVIANPVGPPALVRAPAPNNGSVSGPAFNPPASQLSREGALRPEAGSWSAANPQPTTDGTGRLIPARPLAASAPATPGAASLQRPSFDNVVAGAATRRTAAGRPSFADVSGGAAATPTAAPATSQSGRPLGYGAMVNGVRTFSDGTAGTPATMSRAQIGGLAAGRSLSRADAGVGGNIGGEAFGLTRPTGGSTAAGNVLASTPELGSPAGFALVRPGAQPADPYARARADNIEAQRYAASDAASIATGDTRSVLGRAARAAAIDARSAFGSSGARAAAYRSALEGLNGAAAAGTVPQARLGEAALQDAGETQRAGIRAGTDLATAGLNAQTELQRAALTRPTPEQVPLADGSLGLLGNDGVVRPARGADGMPVRPNLTRSDSATKRSEEIADSIAKSAAQLLTASVPYGTKPTEEQIRGSRLQAAQLAGLRTATGPDGVSRMVEINGEWVPL